MNDNAKKPRKPPFQMCLVRVRLVEEDGLSVREAARRTGYTANAVSWTRKRFKLPPLPPGRRPGG